MGCLEVMDDFCYVLLWTLYTDHTSAKAYANARRATDYEINPRDAKIRESQVLFLGIMALNGGFKRR